MTDLTSPQYISSLTRIREEYEAQYVKSFMGVQEERFNFLADTILKYGLHTASRIQSLGFEKLYQEKMLKFFQEWINVGQNHAMNEIQRSLRMAASQPFKKGMDNAASHYNAYAMKLANVNDKLTLRSAQNIIQLGIRSGETQRETIKRLEKVFPNFTRNRLENIVRTESGKCYNWGRLATFYQNADVVEGVVFSAIMDGRTTDICISRSGLTLPLTDQAGIASNTPPLHYQCRSIWLPVTIGLMGAKYKPNKESYLEYLKNEQPPLDGFGLKDLTGLNKIPYAPTFPPVIPVTIPTPPKPPTTPNPPSTPPTPTPTPAPAPVKATVKPAKTKKVTKPPRQQKLPDMETYKLRGIPKEIQEEIKQIIDDYHDMLQSSKLFDYGVDARNLRGAYAQHGTYSRKSDGQIVGMQLTVDTQSWKAANLQSSLASSERSFISKHFSAHGSFKSTIDHEMGHHIEAIIEQVGGQAHKEFVAARKALMQEFKEEAAKRLGYQSATALELDIASAKVNSWMRAKTLQADYDKEYQEALRPFLSGYAAKNDHEFTAECWAEYMNPLDDDGTGAKPRKLAKTLGDVIVKCLRKIGRMK